MVFRSLPLAALSLLLGFFFVFVGSIKITPKVNPDVYNDMQQEFGRFNKVFPLYKFTGWRPYAKNYRYAVGLIECICGAILILIPGPLKELASFILLCTMFGAFYTHFALGDPFERMAPALVFGLLIVCRFIILYQVSQREKKEFELLRSKFIRECNEKTQNGHHNGKKLASNETDDNEEVDEEQEEEVEAEEEKITSKKVK